MKPLPKIAPMEDREYNSDSTPDECARIKAHVYLYADNIIVLTVLPRASAFSLSLLDSQLAELGENLDYFDLIIDLRDPHQRPNAQMREIIRESVLAKIKMRRAIAVIGSNKLVKFAAQFIFNLSGMPPLLICNSFKEALEALKHDAVD